MLMIRSSASGRLPAEYQEVQWLRGTGTQYCETAFSPYYTGDSFISMKGDITILNASSSSLRICAYESDQYGLQVSGRNVTVGIQPNHGYGTSISGSAPIDAHYEINKTNVIINNIVQSISFEQYSIQNKILIGAWQPSSIIADNNDVLIKTIYLYDDETLISEIIPCTRKADGKAGFYQTNVPTGYDNFIYNLGSGSDWLVGPNV